MEKNPRKRNNPPLCESHPPAVMESEIWIRGAGLITPLGDVPGRVLQSVLAAERAGVATLKTTGDTLEFPARRVPQEMCDDVARLPRLRRASPISLFAMGAAMRCLADAGICAQELSGTNTALVFAASNGSIQYTRRFFEGVARDGPGQGSPMLFPETVYNAPASHVSASLGLGGPSLSLVGDGAAGMEACAVAAQLLASGTADRVLVIAAEELDALALAGYAAWEIAARSSDSPGIIFGEGAAALLLERFPGGQNPQDCTCAISVNPGRSFSSPARAVRQLCRLLADFPLNRRNVVSVFCSASGPQFRNADAKTLARIFPEIPILVPSKSLGDGLSAGALWQLILAREILRSGDSAPAAAISVSIGHNGQLAVAAVQRHGR